MSVLAKLNFVSVDRATKPNAALQRRSKMRAAIAEQKLALSAAMEGKTYAAAVERLVKGEDGKKEKVQTQRKVRNWFFEKDGTWYVQCKYGARTIALSDKGNAVQVKQLADVAAVLDALAAAADAGELDALLVETTAKRKKG